MVQSVGFLDFVSDAFDDVWSAATSIPVVGDALSGLGSDFQDFARTSFGKGFLAAVTTYVTGGLQNEAISLIGPIGAQVGAVGLALPGISQGETFGTSWTQEFLSRTEQLVQIGGSQLAGELVAQYGPELAQKFQDAAAQAGFSSDDLKGYAGQLEGLSSQEFQALANQLGVRADVLQLLSDYVSGTLHFSMPSWASLPAAEQSALKMFGFTQAGYDAANAASRSFTPNGSVQVESSLLASTQHIATSTSMSSAAKKVAILKAVPLVHVPILAAKTGQPEVADHIAAERATRQATIKPASVAVTSAPGTIFGVPTKTAAIGGGVGLSVLLWIFRKAIFP
jgi:hypothetical protein